MNEYKIFIETMKKDVFVTNIRKNEWGLIGFTKNKKIRYLFVKPNYRNRGICSKLINKYIFNDPSPEVIRLLIKHGKCEQISKKLYYYNEFTYFHKDGFQITALPYVNLVSYNKYKNDGTFQSIEFNTSLETSIKEMEVKMKEKIKNGENGADMYEFYDCLNKTLSYKILGGV